MGGQRVCWPPSQVIGGAWPPPPPGPPSSYAYVDQDQCAANEQAECSEVNGHSFSGSKTANVNVLFVCAGGVGERERERGQGDGAGYSSVPGNPTTLEKVKTRAYWAFSRHGFTVKNICRFYGTITGNELPVHFPLFLQAPVNIFRNQAQNGSKGHYIFFFFVIQPYNPTKVFSSTVG